MFGVDKITRTRLWGMSPRKEATKLPFKTPLTTNKHIVLPKPEFENN